MGMLAEPSSERQFIMYEALRKGADIQALHERTHIKTWFIGQMKELVDLDEQLLKHKGALPPTQLLQQAKKDGFSDIYLSFLLGIPEADVRAARSSLFIKDG